MISSSVVSNSNSLLLAVAGATETADGITEIGRGNFQKGIEKTIIGLTGANLGMRLLGIQDKTLPEVMKYSIFAGAIASLVEGVRELSEAIADGNRFSMAFGGAKSIVGIASLSLIKRLDSRIVLVVHQASLLVLAGGFVSKIGIRDLVQGQYKRGIFELLLGAGSIVSACIYGFNEIMHPHFVEFESRISNNELRMGELDENIPSHVSNFLEAHKNETQRICQFKRPVERWSYLGTGISKKTFTHPELPGFLIKVPIDENSVWGHEENDVHVNWKFAKIAQTVIDHHDLNRLVIPKSYIIKVQENRMFAVEQKFDFISFEKVADGPLRTEALNQLEKLIAVNRMCDISVKTDHNAGFLIGSEDQPKIGIYDFDCRRPSDQIDPKEVWEVLAAIAGNLKGLRIGLNFDTTIGKIKSTAVFAGAAMGFIISSHEDPAIVTATAAMCAAIGFAAVAIPIEAAKLGYHGALKAFRWAKKFMPQRA